MCGHIQAGTCKYTYGVHIDNKMGREKFCLILQTYVSDKVDETMATVTQASKHSKVKSTYVLLCTTLGKEGNLVHQ